MPTAGVYEIVNVVDGRNTTYVGSSVRIHTRWIQHKSDLRGDRHGNSHLQRAWKKYGESAFQFNVLEIVEALDELIKREQYWFDLHREIGPVYNVGTCVNAVMRGRTPTAETRAKMSKTMTGRVRSKEHCLALSRAHRGKKLSLEHRRKLSESHKGHKPSLEARRKVSEALAGRPKSAEHRRKAGATHARPYPSFINVETGEIIEAGVNLKRCCENRGLPYQDMDKVKRKERNICKGWILVGGSPHSSRLVKYPAFRHSVTGQTIVPGRNLTRLCRKYGLAYSSMRCVLSGNQLSHRGWMLLEDANADL